jgi:hypothetical protein
MISHQKIKNIVRILVGVLAGLYLGLNLLLSLPAVQRRLSSVAADELGQLLHTEVKIGRVAIGLFNRIILEDVHLRDQSDQEMLRVARLSAKFDLLPLLQQRISIHSVQLFGFRARLYRPTPDEAPNFQFVLDAFASQDTTKSEFPVDVRINSILVRRGAIHYDVQSLPVDSGRFDVNHLHVSNLSATLSLKACSADSLNATVKQLHFEEASGLKLNKLALKVTASPRRLQVQDFVLQLPHSTLQLDTLAATYDSLPELKQFTRRVAHQGTLSGQVVLKDIAPLVPALRSFTLPLDLHLAWTGRGTNIDVNHLSITHESHLTIHAEGGLGKEEDEEDIHIYGLAKNFYADSEALERLAESLGEQKAAETLKSLGYIHLTGQYEGRPDAMHIDGHVRTEVGEAETHLTMQREATGRTYSGHIVGSGVDLGRILNQPDTFGETDFNLELQGFNYSHNQPETYVKGQISSFVYKDYPYQNITLDGQFREGGFNGHLALDDENGAIALDGSFNTSGRTKTFNLQAAVDHLRPHSLNWTGQYPDADFSLRLNADFSGSSVDDMNGTVRLDSLVMAGDTPETSYTLPQLTLTAQKDDDEREVRIQSPFLQATVKGHYAYHTVPASLLRIAEQYIPALVTVNKNGVKPDNVFRFDIHVEPDACFERLLHVPLHLEMPLDVSGTVDDRRETLHLEGHFPDVTYAGTHYTGAVLQCDTPTDQLKCYFRSGILLGSGATLNVALNATAQDDCLHTSLDWGNNTAVTYGGKLAATTRFTKTEGPHPTLRADIQVLPTQVVLNDTVWHIHGSHIQVDSGRVSVDRFLFEHADQHLLIDGRLGNRPTDECLVELQKLNIQYILDIVHFDDVAFGGLATGTARLRGVLKEPDVQVNLDVDQFAVNGGLMGRALIHGQWDKELGGIRLNADIHEDSFPGMWAGPASHTQVDGYVSFKEKGLDLHIDADRTNLKLLEPFIEGIFSRIDGRADGHIRLYGDFKHLDLEGQVRASVRAHLDVLHTDFIVRDDSVHITSGQLYFDKVKIEDPEGNTGVVTGYLRHTKLKNINYRFGIDGENLLMYDTREPDDMPFYGRVYATGHVDLDGGWNAMNVNAAFTTGRRTTFTYLVDYTTEALSNQFITFVDKTPGRVHNAVSMDLGHPKAEEPKADDEPAMDLNIHMQIDATPNATMRLIMDPIAGDNITATGRGNLQVNYYNKGDFRIFGNYVIDQGKYKLSMQEVIRKDFTLQSGGTVSFAGDPYEADLDVQAVYTVNSASMSDLGVDTSMGGQSTVKVNCLMNLTGNLSNPDFKFDLELPNVKEEDRELVRSITATEEQMNTQIIYLLGVGKFYTADYAMNDQQSNATSSLAFTTLSGQINNMLSQWIDSNNWNIGANLSTGDKGWSDVEAEAVLSGRLLNNRLIVNGNFGYKDNAMLNSNFVGDFEAIWLLTRNGDIRLRAYNQTNDRYLFKSTLTTQGVGISYKKDFDSWTDLFYRFLRKKKQTEREKE